MAAGDSEKLKRRVDRLEHHTRLLDVYAVISLAVLPVLVYGILAFGNEIGSVGYSFRTDLVILIVRSIQVAVPILVIMHLRKIKWSEFGFVKFRPIPDMVKGGLLMATCMILFYLGAAVWQRLFLDDPGIETEAAFSPGPDYSIAVFLLILVASLANSFAEELAIRSYLLVRLKEITGRPVLAVFVTSAIFASYHIYQGVVGLVYAFFVGMILGSYFARTNRFWPIFVAHFFLDAIPMAQSLKISQ